jgi:microcystin-dependent protein
MNKNFKIKNDSKSRRGFLLDITKWVGGTAILAATANVFTSNKTNAAADPNSIQAEAQPYIGSIDMVGFNFAPVGWALCSGQLLSISEYETLFQLIGTTYGGDGQTTFGLPNFQGRMPVHKGQGSGLSSLTIGEMGGTESVTLNVNQIPSHNHLLAVNSDGGTSDNPSGNYMAANSEGIKHYSNTAGSNANTNSIGEYGSSQAHSNMSPYLAVNFIISLYGIFPSQN